jgi:hypothetical protein
MYMAYCLLLVVVELSECQHKYDPSGDYNIQLARMLNQSSDRDAGPWLADDQINVTLKFWIYNIIAVVCAVKYLTPQIPPLQDDQQETVKFISNYEMVS